MRFVKIDDTHWVNVGTGTVAWVQRSGDATLIVWQTGKYVRVAKDPEDLIQLLEEG